MVVNNIRERLASTGFSGYGAKAYSALLSQNHVTFCELAKTSRIPTSKIYEVLLRRPQKKVVRRLGQDRARKYVPLDPAEFIAEFKRGIETHLKALRKALHPRPAVQDSCGIYLLHKRDLDDATI